MDDDWDIDEVPAAKPSTSAPPPAAPRAAAKAKWQGEDEEDEQDDWDASEDEKPKPSAAAPAPAKKKKTLKQIIEEKKQKEEEAKLNGGDDEIMDTMTAQERRRLAREAEIQADMDNARELFGDMSTEDSKDNKADLEAIFKSTPKTKEDFATLSKQLVSTVISRHTSAALYPAFVEQFAKDLCENLNAVQTRKVSSALSVLGNTKQQDERDKASGKKKTAGKPKLGAIKTVSKVDTEAYDDVLDDDDFM